jgi:hypothetical protein
VPSADYRRRGFSLAPVVGLSVVLVVWVKKLVRMMNPVDFRRSGAVASGKPAALDLRSSSALADQAVMGSTGEEQVSDKSLICSPRERRLVLPANVLKPCSRRAHGTPTREVSFWRLRAPRT